MRSVFFYYIGLSAAEIALAISRATTSSEATTETAPRHKPSGLEPKSQETSYGGLLIKAVVAVGAVVALKTAVQVIDIHL